MGRAESATVVRKMKTTHLILVTAALAVCGAWTSPAEGKVYRWVDENGVVHFGDAIPPEYSRERHEVLDERGGRTTVNDAEATPAPVRDDRDRALLATYSSVAEIEEVRDRRAGYLVSQNSVAEERLVSLEARRETLAGDPGSVNELATVEQRIGEYEAEIERRNLEIARIRAGFDEDMRRFRELKGIQDPGTAEGAADEPGETVEKTAGAPAAEPSS